MNLQITPVQFGMFHAVMVAAREGRFMFGNGADWYIVEPNGTKVCLNTVDVTRTEVPDYSGVPMKCATTEKILAEFLGQTVGS